MTAALPHEIADPIVRSLRMSPGDVGDRIDRGAQPAWASRTGAGARQIRRLNVSDLADLRQLVDADPFVSVLVAARLEAGVSPDLDGEFVGVGGPGQLQAACWRGPTLLPIGGDADLWREFAEYLGPRRGGCSSMLGRADAIDALWQRLSRRWGRARVIRPCQPLMLTDRRPAITADGQVRLAMPADLDRYLPAADAMYTEELGLPPFSGSARRTYRARLAELIAARRVFVRLDRQGGVAFKAEIGVVSRATSQIQGVWVRPDLRGRGVGTSAMATVVNHALQLAPTASLYVNDFNIPARRLYERLGMHHSATLATVLF
jgi:uncharacterized protein